MKRLCLDYKAWAYRRRRVNLGNGVRLHKLTGSHCPECGAALCLTVGTIEPYLRPWIVLVVSSCQGAGLGLVWICVLIGEGSPQDRFFASIIGGLSCIQVALGAIFMRSLFVRIGRSTQWAIAACFMALMRMTYIAFLYGLSSF